MTPQTRNATITVGLASLIVGAMLGMTAEKFHGRGRSFVPSTAKNASLPGKAPAGTTGKSSNAGAWNPWQEIRDVQLEMDHLFQGTLAGTSSTPWTVPAAANPGYAFSLKMQDLKDRYEVHAFLPETKAANAKVSLQGDRTLEVEVSNKEDQTSKGDVVANVTEWGLYQQTLELPSPVKVDQMKIDRKDHELVITLPKAAG